MYIQSIRQLPYPDMISNHISHPKCLFPPHAAAEEEIVRTSETERGAVVTHTETTTTGV